MLKSVRVMLYKKGRIMPELILVSGLTTYACQ